MRHRAPLRQPDGGRDRADQAGQDFRRRRGACGSARAPLEGHAMTARIIDGKALADDLFAKVTGEVQRLASRHGLTPGLAVVLVGNNPASEIYVRSKSTKTLAAGMHSAMHKLPADVSEDGLLDVVRQLNGDRAVHGILVQLPLPPQVDPHKVIAAIDPAKDVDGFHPVNAGKLAIGLPALVPCTP